MTLGEVAHITETSLHERKTSAGGFLAKFEHLEIMEDDILSDAVGFGTTARKARVDLAACVSWQRVVTGAYSYARNEFEIPQVTPKV